MASWTLDTATDQVPGGCRGPATGTGVDRLTGGRRGHQFGTKRLVCCRGAGGGEGGSGGRRERGRVVATHHDTTPLAGSDIHSAVETTPTKQVRNSVRQAAARGRRGLAHRVAAAHDRPDRGPPTQVTPQTTGPTRDRSRLQASPHMARRTSSSLLHHHHISITNWPSAATEHSVRRRIKHCTAFTNRRPALWRPQRARLHNK